MSKRGLFVFLLTIAVMVAAGVVTWAVLSHMPATAASTAPEHHGMSPAIWVAIFTGVWVPLLAGASRRRREKKDREDKQP